MPYFVISGKPNCPHFMHAIHVAKYLSERLPNFIYQKVEKLATEWAKYVYKLNKENTWYITESPLIWKEINIWGGKKHLIGGLSEFWEYVYCYYGLESICPKTDLEKLAADNLKFFVQHQKIAMENEKNVRVIAIHGASAPQTFHLIDSLLQISDLEKREGMCFKLYDTQSNFEKSDETTTYFNNLSIYGNRNVVTIAATEEEAVKDVDILIHVGDFRKKIRENMQACLKRCFISMQHLAEIINKHARRNCIVIMNNHGPVCFLATCLVEMCTRLRPSNIVAVTADMGLSVLNVVSEESGIPVEKLSAPPVWGSVGLCSFVDERHIVFKADVYRPYERALSSPIGSTLPLGTMKSELRLLTNLMTDHEKIKRTIDERHAKMNVRLNRAPILAKIRAVTSLLKLWFASPYSDSIISLGVSSNGSFGITPGIVFSQPVKLDDRGKWVPFDTFPLLSDFTRSQIQECVSVCSEVLQLCGIEKNDDISPVDIVSMDSDSSSTQDDEESDGNKINEGETLGKSGNIDEHEEEKEGMNEVKSGKESDNGEVDKEEKTVDNNEEKEKNEEIGKVGDEQTYKRAEMDTDEIIEIKEKIVTIEVQESEENINVEKVGTAEKTHNEVAQGLDGEENMGTKEGE
ncbi:unnamed protein product [Phaedon cochleariae]|uniref:Malate dehydrogenase 1B n=1 Tax=Phaedon cochleariae TaxID=80249 RepID=A0A9P0GX19_PHACE|nr:unnamed protein product [Phaedon cochleariae]